MGVRLRPHHAKVAEQRAMGRVNVRIGCHRRTLLRSAFATNSSIDGTPHASCMARGSIGDISNSPMPPVGGVQVSAIQLSDESRYRAKQIVSGFHMAEGFDQGRERRKGRLRCQQRRGAA